MDDQGANFTRGASAPGGLQAAVINLFTHKKRPTYTIAPEYEQNKALAEQEAFGTNPSIVRGMNAIDQSAASDVNTAQQYTSNTSSILNLLASINKNKTSDYQNLFGQNAMLQSQGRSKLMGANAAMAEERDKAWNFNVNEPYQNELAAERDFQKSTEEAHQKRADTLMSFFSSMYGGGGKMGGGKSSVDTGNV